MSRVSEWVELLRRRGLDRTVRAGIVLGSGLSTVAEGLEADGSVEQSELRGYPAARVPGHAGRLVWGRWGGVPVMVSQGRAHLYEGHPPSDLALPLALFRKLGADRVFLASAAGGIAPDHVPGDIVVLTDHLNLMGASPLEGAHFVDMTGCYDSELRGAAHRAARAASIGLKEGVLAAVRGPQYETPAEVRMLRTLGADLVSMSMVPEAISARRHGLRVLGLALVANRAAGLSGDPIEHRDVLANVETRASDVARIIIGVLEISEPERT